MLEAHKAKHFQPVRMPFGHGHRCARHGHEAADLWDGCETVSLVLFHCRIGVHLSEKQNELLTQPATNIILLFADFTEGTDDKASERRNETEKDEVRAGLRIGEGLHHLADGGLWKPLRSYPCSESPCL